MVAISFKNTRFDSNKFSKLRKEWIEKVVQLDFAEHVLEESIYQSFQCPQMISINGHYFRYFASMENKLQILELKNFSQFRNL